MATHPQFEGDHNGIAIVFLSILITTGGCMSCDRIASWDSPPRLEPIPPISVYAGDTFTITPVAVDPDGDPVTISYSGWMDTSSRSTTASDRGDHSVIVTASDGRTESSRTVSITVLNNPPQFQSLPVTETSIGALYSYSPAVYDRDNDILLYSMIGAPVGMSLSSQSGQLTWVPANLDPGSYAIQITASDGYGGYASQAFTLTVPPAALFPVSAVGISPPARYAHSAIYDEYNQRMIVFGGFSCTPSCYLYNDVWALYFIGTSPTWVKLNPTGIPPSARYAQSAVYDPVNQQMVVFGGYDASEYKNDAWALSLTNVTQWSSLPSPPAGLLPRSDHSAIFDPSRDRMLIFGGWNGTTYFSDVWALSLTGSVAWAQLFPAGVSPTGLTSSRSAIYDPDGGGRMVIFGGLVSGGGYTNGTWALDLSGDVNGVWSRILPTGVLPSPRYLNSAVYDPTRRMIIFGGYDGSSFTNDTWALGLGSTATPIWTKIAFPGPLPTIRYGHSAIFDPVSGRMVIMDGTNLTYVGGTNALDDLWMMK